ncbi:MAG: hypothetical protein IAE67_03355 [Candidatus Competibacteraceae bacterium]|nr:hypothetical protein [Candidatus Competibacteraceae bacterium]
MHKFLQISLGIALIVASLGFVIRSFQPTFANNDVIAPSQHNEQAGRIMMNQSVVYSSGENMIYHYILVWDSETGKSKLYWFDRNDKRSYAWEAFGKDLPENPL